MVIGKVEELIDPVRRLKDGLDSAEVWIKAKYNDYESEHVMTDGGGSFFIDGVMAKKGIIYIFAKKEGYMPEPYFSTLTQINLDPDKAVPLGEILLRPKTPRTAVAPPTP